MKDEAVKFYCIECDKEYPLEQQFLDKPVCIVCAKGVGVSHALVSEKTAEQDNIESIQDSKESLLEDNIKKNSNESGRMVDKTVKKNELKIEETDWVDLPRGEFLMGSPIDEQGRGDDEGLHRVELEAFKIMATTVTFEQYDHFCQETGRKFAVDKGWGRATRPVVCVSYWDAVDYAEWLSEQTGWHCRLPTEAEWEYACRSGSNTPFNTGKSISGAQANYDGLYTYVGGTRANSRWMTMPVVSFPANAWGLYEMHGNVWEWCASEYDADYSGLEKMDASTDRMNNIPRSLRGGSWHSRPALLRSAYRYRFIPNESSYEWGFRLVRVET